MSRTRIETGPVPAAQQETGQVEPTRRLVPLAWAGIVGPALFTVAFLVQEAFRIDEYSPLAEPVSALEAGPNGWVQQVSFVVFAVLTVAFAAGLWQSVRRSATARVGSALLLVSGVGAFIAGTFPLREDSAGVTYDPGGHVVGGMSFFLGSAVGLLVLSFALARDPRWAGLARYTRLVGAIAVLSVPVNVFLVVPEEAVLHDWAGLVQRIVVLLVLFPCRTLLAVRMLRIACGR